MDTWTYLDAGNRLCQLCHTDVDDEYHFMSRSNKYLLQKLFFDIR